MRDCREEWYDREAKVSVTIVDVTGAAQALAKGHLCGPTSARFLAEGLAAAALLGAETNESGEVVSLQVKCEGPLGGLNVECTDAGTLRGYTEKKILEDFDGLGCADRRMVLGKCRVQVTRSLPGKILSQGISNSLDGYLAGSLQRRACIHLEASVNDEVEVLEARGVMIEILPDAPDGSVHLLGALDGKGPKGLSVASRNLLKRIGVSKAELRKSVPLSFACRCSSERAVAMLGALSFEERAKLPPTLDITCHMCGRTFTVRTEEL